MSILRKILLLLLSVLFFISSHGQETAEIDSIKLSLAKAKTVEEKIKWLDNLSRTLMNDCTGGYAGSASPLTRA